MPPEALGRSSKQREPPLNPAQESDGAKEEDRQREKRPESARQHFVLSARPSFLLPRSAPFIGREGAVSSAVSFIPYRSRTGIRAVLHASE